MKNGLKKATRYSLIFFAFKVLVCSLIFIPAVNSYVSNIPILKSIAGFVSNDTKVSEAKNNEGNIVSVAEDGYTFKVDSATLDKEKLLITGSISGPELVYNPGGEYPADVEIVPKDFKESSTTEGGGNKLYGHGDTFNFQVEEDYKVGEVGKFLEKGQDYLMLDVMVYRRSDVEGKSVGRKVVEGEDEKRDYRVYWKENDESIKEFKSIKVPFSYNK